MVTFKNPEYFWLLALILPMLTWYILRYRRLEAAVQFSSFLGLGAIGTGWKRWLRHLPFALYLTGIAGLSVALARPQSSKRWENVTTEGIDIVIALDISSSMLEADFNPNRLEAAKNVAVQFIAGRPNDNIGLVVFAGESFTQCPLTTDHATLSNLFGAVYPGVLEDGTAVGNGLATAVSRLKDSEAISKVIILLTDGENNRGEVAPLSAAEIAKTFGIRVYTIGLGSYRPDVKIDENTLTEISKITGGQYFRATNNNKLTSIYQEIDKLEKSKIEVSERQHIDEEYRPVALIAGIVLTLGLLLRITVFKSIP
ncbi:MAG: VWA domain-containing protein [Bacteroidales bacterium]|jgi:Ca-activated chloride channel family protein|nr:VWA domain-containing protein [Bacteroidales bacterium]